MGLDVQLQEGSTTKNPTSTGRRRLAATKKPQTSCLFIGLTLIGYTLEGGRDVVAFRRAGLGQLARQLEDGKLRVEIHNPFFRSLWFVHLIFLSEVSSCPPYWRLSAVPSFWSLLTPSLILPLFCASLDALLPYLTGPDQVAN